MGASTRSLLGVAATCLLLLAGCATSNSIALNQPTVVDVACGECLFKMPGKGCDLAIRLNGRGYYVDGVDLDSLGNAHATDGMCMVIRKARVTGELRNGRFISSSFQLLPAPPLP
ncbi:MAG: hypothetical protein RIS76_1861 [Verrucomicrobiota bacterium]|jgi:Family of unknown function (DUF6370)